MRITAASQYRLQAWLVALQIMVTLGAWLMAMIFAKMMSYFPDESRLLGPFIRHGAILLLLVPPFWAYFTIKRENDLTSYWTRRHTLLSGIVLGVILVFLAGWAANYGRITRRGPIQQISAYSPILPIRVQKSLGRPEPLHHEPSTKHSFAIVIARSIKSSTCESARSTSACRCSAKR